MYGRMPIWSRSLHQRRFGKVQIGISSGGAVGGAGAAGVGVVGGAGAAAGAGGGSSSGSGKWRIPTTFTMGAKLDNTRVNRDVRTIMGETASQLEQMGGVEVDFRSRCRRALMKAFPCRLRGRSPRTVTRCISGDTGVMAR